MAGLAAAQANLADITLLSRGTTVAAEALITRDLARIAMDRMIAFNQSNGRWSDVGGSGPGSFDVAATGMVREGLRVTRVPLWDAGVFRRDVAHLIASNTRDPASIIGGDRAICDLTGSLPCIGTL